MKVVIYVLSAALLLFFPTNSSSQEIRQETLSTLVRSISEKVPWRQKRRVGISPFRDLQVDRVTVFGKTLAAELTSALSGSKKFHVVTLNLDSLAEVLRKELSDLKDPATTARLGRLFGIQVLLTGSYYQGWLGRKFYVEVTDLERGDVWGVTARELSPARWVWGMGGLVLLGAVVFGRQVRRSRRERKKRLADASYAAAMEHYAAGRLEEARVQAQAALKVNPAHFEAQVLLDKIDKALANRKDTTSVVTPQMKPPSPPPEKPTPPEPPRPSFTIRVWTDKADAPTKQDRLHTRDVKALPVREESRYKLGDRIIVYFAADRDCHLRLVNIGPTGSMVQIFPNRWHPDSFLRAGDIHALPGPEYQGFQYRLGPPAGLEIIRAIACTEPFELAGSEQDEYFARITTRNIEVLPAENAKPMGLRTEDSCRFFVSG